MKALKIVLVLALIYVGIVAAFESLIGYFQPSNQGTLTITTTDANGDQNDRVLSRLESGGNLYVAVNHWPRAWFKQAMARPDVQVALDSAGANKAQFTAVQVNGDEYDRVESDNPAPFFFRLLTGFPPRYFIRLDPKA